MAKEHAPEIPVRFYRTEAGTEPVLEWLRGLAKEDRRVIGSDLMRVQFGWPIGMLLVRSLKDGLWEVRSTLPSQRIARLILCFHQGTLVVLHGFNELDVVTVASVKDRLGVGPGQVPSLFALTEKNGRDSVLTQMIAHRR